MRSSSPRLTLLSALIAISAIGAPTARAGDASDLGEPVADATPAATTTAAGPAPQAGSGGAVSGGAGSGGAVSGGAVSGGAVSGGGRSRGASSAEIEQGAQQGQGGGAVPYGGGAGLYRGGGQVQQVEQNATLNQDAESQALAEQQATTAATLPVEAAEVDWSAILTQLPWASGVEEILAMGRNGSLVLQAIWQVQHGCNNNCTGTSQSQSARQQAGTTQDATAIAGDESVPSGGAPAPSTAEARNRSVTIQFVWQTQIGCVAFCVRTSQTQTATQWAQTNQSATAVGSNGAIAENLSQPVQLVWQVQEGCRQECYGAPQAQVINQAQETTQSASATSGADVAVPVQGADGTVVLPGWLVALAENLGVTIQTIYQLQEAACAEYCEGDSQVQEAVQRAEVSQEAAARRGGPPAHVAAPSEEPPTPQPPTPHPPADQPAPAPQSPVNPDGPIALAAIRDPSSPASRRVRSQLTELASRGRESRPRSLVVVLSSSAQASLKEPSTITGSEFISPFTAIAFDSANRRTPKSPATHGSDSPTSTTFGGTTDGGSDRGWLWIAVLAASLVLLPALRHVPRRPAGPGTDCGAGSGGPRNACGRDYVNRVKLRLSGAPKAAAARLEAAAPQLHSHTRPSRPTLVIDSSSSPDPDPADAGGRRPQS